MRETGESEALRMWSLTHTSFCFHGSSTACEALTSPCPTANTIFHLRYGAHRERSIVSLPRILQAIVPTAATSSYENLSLAVRL